MENETKNLNVFDSLSDLNSSAEQSIIKLQELERQVELSNQKHMNAYKLQMQAYQKAMERINVSTSRFIHGTMNQLGATNDE